MSQLVQDVREESALSVSDEVASEIVVRLDGQDDTSDSDRVESAGSLSPTETRKEPQTQQSEVHTEAHLEAAPV